MPGTLYVVATPIGNLADLTPRAAKTLAEVDFIAAEDTRVTLKLLNHLGLKKPLVSYRQHNARAAAPALLCRLQAGESCALCTDAGTPAISDPGEEIVALAVREGIRVVPIPAASAAIAALCVSGQPTARFVFEGFLPQQKRERTRRLRALQAEERTLILYEAPHKLTATLLDLGEAFGAQRPITLCRELTKLHEEIWQTTLAKASAHYAQNTPRGEFVLVLAGAPPADSAPEIPLADAAALALRLAAECAMSAGDAARRAANETGHAKNDIYREMQTQK